MHNSNRIRPVGRIGQAILRWSAAAGLILSMSGVSVAQVVGPIESTQPLNVVATFSILGDMVKEVGGEYVDVTTIVGPNTDAHTFEPTPSDIKAVADAQVLVLNGLDFEGWLPRLVDAAGFNGIRVLASEGVTVRHLSDAGHTHSDKHEHGHDHQTGDVDPHAWQSLENGMIYANNIADGLIKAAPMHRAYFKNRLSLYLEQMKKLDDEIKLVLADVPQAKRKVVSAHDAFGYFAQAYNIRFFSVAGLSSQAEPSAKEMAALINNIKKMGVSGVFVEHGTNSKLVDQIARETHIKVGGALYSDALAPSDQPASTYLGMFSWNAGQLIYVLKDGVLKH